MEYLNSTKEIEESNDSNRLLYSLADKMSHRALVCFIRQSLRGLTGTDMSDTVQNYNGKTIIWSTFDCMQVIIN